MFHLPDCSVRLEVWGLGYFPHFPARLAALAGGVLVTIITFYPLEDECACEARGVSFC